MRKLLALIVLVFVGVSLAQNKPEALSDISVSVVKATNGKPVRNATVVLHSLDSEGKQGTGGLNLKTDSDGKASIRGIPQGKLRVQVIARGFQTYGEDFTLDKPEQELSIKLKPPADQYSIYGDNKPASPK